MFESSSIMILANTDEKSDRVLKLETNQDTQNKIDEIFDVAKRKLVDTKGAIEFNGTYKPDKDEYLFIQNFELDDDIIDAIRNPLSVDKFEKRHGKYPNIKAIFVGERQENKESESFYIAFQLFKKEQQLSAKGRLNLFFDQNTFSVNSKFGISVSNTIECYFNKNRLEFNSFYYARQIFDLSRYYRSATDEEVKSFMTNELLLFENENGGVKK